MNVTPIDIDDGKAIRRARHEPHRIEYALALDAVDYAGEGRGNERYQNLCSFIGGTITSDSNPELMELYDAGVINEDRAGELAEAIARGENAPRYYKIRELRKQAISGDGHAAVLLDILGK
jgi:hypothetical protein